MLYLQTSAETIKHILALIKKIIQMLVPPRHLGEIKNGVEEQKDWAGATENYFLEENNHVTSLDVVMDTTPEMEVYLNNTFPNAMEKLKQICEQ